MAEVASAYVTLIPSARGFATGIQKQTGPEADRAGGDAGKRFGLSFKKVIGGLGLAAAGGAVIGFLHDSVGAASDLNETVNKSSVIFGKNAAAVDRWASTADRALGLSRQAALDSASSFGDMFSQLGIGRNRATKMSEGVVQLAADLGSFNNLGTDDVLERLAGGFRGEYDALQKVIPNISAARVQQEALRLSHKKSVSDLTAAEKATATLAIVQHDGRRAAGDFARTSTGLANSQKIQAAEVENLKAKIGTGLLPIQLKATRFLADEAIPAISDFVGGMQDGTGAGGDLVDVLKETLGIGKEVVGFFNSLPGPVKKYGVELLIAAVALNKVNNLGRGLVASLTPADATMTRTAKASYALGVGLRNLAGAGGMIAVADGAKRGTSALGALEVTAGAAATGFAVGGPLGAGIGAAAGGLFSLAKYAYASNSAAKSTMPTMAQFAATLDGVGAASTKATRALVYESLQKSGLLDKTRDLSISDRDAVLAATGNAAARQRVSAALADATAKGKGYQALQVAQKLGAETSALRSSRVEQLQKNLALAGTKKEAQAIQAKLDRLARTNANPRIRIGGADIAINKLNAVLTLLHEIGGTGGGNAQLPKPNSLLGQLSGRARGGPVVAGQPYIVGETRPELFIPNQSGRIVPQVPVVGGAGGPQFNVEKVYAQDVNDFLRQMQTRARHSSLDGVRR